MASILEGSSYLTLLITLIYRWGNIGVEMVSDSSLTTLLVRGRVGSWIQVIGRFHILPWINWVSWASHFSFLFCKIGRGVEWIIQSGHCMPSSSFLFWSIWQAWISCSTHEDFRFTPVLLWFEQSAVLNLDFSGWGCSDHKPINLAAGWRAPPMPKSGAACSFEFLLFSAYCPAAVSWCFFERKETSCLGTWF